MLGFCLCISVLANESPEFSLNLAYPFEDADSDSMQDSWEVAHGLAVGVQDAGTDPDGDGRPNLAEYNAGTDPQVRDEDSAFCLSGLFGLALAQAVVDSDADGMADAWELARGLTVGVNDAALDPDGDGRNNLAEYNGNWNPQVAERRDSSQAVSPSALLDTGAYPLGFSADTDADGMPDWWEVKYGLNRLIHDASGDLDADGFSNVQEYRAGMVPNRNDLWGVAWAVSLDFLLDTIGISPDTDSDGMRDWWEMAHGLNHLVPDPHLDPDGDGRNNLAEYNAATDPQVNDWRGPSIWASLDFTTDTGGFNGGYADDTDGDGMPDWWEISYALLPAVHDAAGNPDGDALSNVQEYNAGTNPRVFDFLIVDDADGNLFPLDTGGRFLDSDLDGIPNWWERLNCGSSTGLVAETDSDQDGYSNYEEFVGRSNPSDPGSLFQVETISPPVGGGAYAWVITWDTSPDRLYSVFANTNLAAAWPTAALYQVQGDGAPKSFTNTVPSPVPCVYRVTVEINPLP
jgi:hypothetical protein